jgi:glutathione S-transferase
MCAAHELGLAARIEFVPTVVSIVQADAELLRFNPLSQIPTLVLDDGAAIYDSLVICEYLDLSTCAPRLIPGTCPARHEVLSRHALGQGMIDALIRIYSERKRTADPLQPTYVEAFRRKFNRAADALDRHHRRGADPTSVDIADIAAACALAYADFRLGVADWRDGRDALAAWHARFAERPSMRLTAFPA